MIILVQVELRRNRASIGVRGGEGIALARGAHVELLIELLIHTSIELGYLNRIAHRRSYDGLLSLMLVAHRRRRIGLRDSTARMLLSLLIVTHL